MKIKYIICSICSAAVILTSGITASASKFHATAKVKQYDEICGYVNVQIAASEDAYIKIIKYTPETTETGYIVYDEKVDHILLGASDIMIYPLEYNNYNVDTKQCEGSYDIMVGFHKHKNSSDPNDIVYSKVNLVVPDVNYCGYETNCNINISVTDDDLDEPIFIESGKPRDMTYDITFSSIESIAGDADNNGVVNILDAAYIAKKIAGRKVDELPEFADYNGRRSARCRGAEKCLPQ